MFSVQIKKPDGGTYSLAVDLNPDTCPICQRGIEAVDHSTGSLLGERGEILERVFRCPWRSCLRLFIGRYYRNTQTGEYHLKQCVPTEPKGYAAPSELQEISKDFCSIYDQAQKAEQLGLDLVSGPGYRKALEFLVKDYLISLQSTEEAKKEVKELALMPCIKKYVTDTRMRTTAERATWLGNDETHYIRKWEDKDLQDLKKFIQLTCYWIQSEHLTNAAVTEMPQGKK